MSNGWLQVDKTAKPPMVKRKVPNDFAASPRWISFSSFKVDNVSDEIQTLLKRIESLEVSDASAKEVVDLKKRKLVEDV